MLFISVHMCEILHIAQYQRWMGLKQTAVWYVLLVRRRGAPSLILWCSHLLCLCLIPHPPWLFQTIGSSCELVKTLWNVAKEAAWPANGFNRASGNAPQKLLVEEYKMRCETWKDVETQQQQQRTSRGLICPKGCNDKLTRHGNVILPVFIQ